MRSARLAFAESIRPLPEPIATEARRTSLVGDFVTGTLATILATPCSAPFLGTAVGFALAGEAGTIFAVFAGLGLGMALPYLALAAVPGFARVLPKPGRWMIRLKQILAVALAATVAWLLTVLAAQQSEATALIVAALIVAIAFMLAMHRRGPFIWRSTAFASVALLAIAAVAIPLLAPEASNASADSRRATKSTARYWQRFDPAAIPELIAQGKTVFVDVTADWCITCQVNKATVLDRQPVKALLEDERVIAMQGDWTRPDPEIAAYLQSFGRYAIPFNAVYGPGAPDGILLSELLTTTAVLEALATSSGGALVERR